MNPLNKRIDTLLNSEKPTNDKLQQICQLLHDEIEHYNWVGFYFHDEDDKTLNLGPFVGAATDHTKIPFGKGICGQVAESNETFVVPDVQAQDNYLSCSIDTKSEIVVPIFKADKNIGQIDIDSHAIDPFTQSDITFLEDLMVKLAKIL